MWGNGLQIGFSCDTDKYWQWRMDASGVKAQELCNLVGSVRKIRRVKRDRTHLERKTGVRKVNWNFSFHFTFPLYLVLPPKFFFEMCLYLLCICCDWAGNTYDISCHYVCVEIKGPLTGVSSLFPPCGLEDKAQFVMMNIWRLYPLNNLPSSMILLKNHQEP